MYFAIIRILLFARVSFGSFLTSYHPFLLLGVPAGKEGAIILATGGDQSDGAIGNFYEGYMATGATTNETDDAIQANIVAVGYKLLAW